MLGQIDVQKREEAQKIKFSRCVAEWSNCYYKNFDANKMLKELYSYEFEQQSGIDDYEENQKEMEVIKMFERNRR